MAEIPSSIFDASCPADEALEKAIEATLLHDDDTGGWLIAWRESTGRHLIASRWLDANELVFRECALVTASASSVGDEQMMALAFAILNEPKDSAVHVLQHIPASASSASSHESWAHRMFKQYVLGDGGAPPGRVTASLERVTWALGVASLNMHSVSHPCRGVLGILSSMMEHSCEPSAIVEIGGSGVGSSTSSIMLTLRTTRAVAPGESLSICYVGYDLVKEERRRRLLFQHGFKCVCKRCGRV